jgi:hypothetical protein
VVIVRNQIKSFSQYLKEVDLEIRSFYINILISAFQMILFVIIQDYIIKQKAILCLVSRFFTQKISNLISLSLKFKF